MGENVTISSGQLTASVNVLGAELQSLKDLDGRELMTDADPAYWSGRAPFLFPIVGRLHNDTLSVNGEHYAMQKHGFARKSVFDLIEASSAEALFRLSDYDETRAQYPFAFELDAHFRVSGTSLHQTLTVRNTGDLNMPFSVGYHPAFAWPLPFGCAREEHLIRFEKDEHSSLCRVTPYGTIAPDAVPTPVRGNEIRLSDSLFNEDALVWQGIESRRLSYGVPGFPSLIVEFPDTTMLGIWTKPGAAFMCIEPWAGIADPQGYHGEFADKPGIMHLSPAQERSFRMDIAITY